MKTNNTTETDIAVEASRSAYEEEVLKEHLVAKQSHNADLFKTQQHFQGCEEGDVLVLVRFSAFTDTHSCMKTSFPTGCVRLNREHIVSTGSKLLNDLLESESYQRRAKSAAEPLPKGVDYVLNLSPTTEEDAYTVALQRLSITNGIRLWYRCMALGGSVAAVAGHDDACGCNEQWDAPYPMQSPPASIGGVHATSPLKVAAYLFDTGSWAIDEHRDIDEFCPVRQGANVLRLFRSLADKDLHIDSAPRLWTLVGLFGMFEMTNYDLLRDQVSAWFSDNTNPIFMELLPEETIRMASVLKTPMLSEPAFRILVNERALDVAGGNPHGRNNITVFGRRSSGCLHGTEDTERILQAIEHAGVAMADRYKKALDNICGSGALSILSVKEWEKLLAVGKVIPATGGVRTSYDALLSAIRITFLGAIDKIINKPPENLCRDVNTPGKDEDIEAALVYSVPRRELNGSRSFEAVYATLNKTQRALCPFLWLSLREIEWPNYPDKRSIRHAALMFKIDWEVARDQGLLLPGSYPTEFEAFETSYIDDLFERIIDGLKSYVEPLVSRSGFDFTYTVTPHMVLALSEQEMNYFRLEDETAYDSSIPEAELGPSGPGPSFHTGITIPSVSDSVAQDFEDLVIHSEDGDGASTVVGSEVAQDGISTVYDRHRVIAQSSSIASEGFMDDAMNVDYAEAGSAVPGHHQIFSPYVALDDGQVVHDDYTAYTQGLSDLESQIGFEPEDDDEEEDDTEGEGDGDEDDDIEIITHHDAEAPGLH